MLSQGGVVSCHTLTVSAFLSIIMVPCTLHCNATTHHQLITLHHHTLCTALDKRTTSIRELLRQVKVKRIAKANPRLKINVDIHNRPDAPTAFFKFIDETEQSFETYQYNCFEMIFQIHLKGMQLDAEYELDGKNIDEK